MPARPPSLPNSPALRLASPSLSVALISLPIGRLTPRKSNFTLARPLFGRAIHRARDAIMGLKQKGDAMSGTTPDRETHTHRIVRDPKICGGEPVFRGTRVTLRTVLASLAAGDSPQDILADFPALKSEDVQSAIAFAAASAEEDLSVPEVPRIR